MPRHLDSCRFITYFIINITGPTFKVLASSIQENVVKLMQPLVVVCVGDSINHGVSMGATSSYAYPARLQSYFDPKIVKVLNLGSDGASVLKVNGKPYWDMNEYSSSLDSSPNYVILQFGTNDAKKGTWNETNFRSLYIDLIDEYQSLESRPTVLLCTPPPISIPFEIEGGNKTSDYWADSFRSNIVNNVIPVILLEIANITGSIFIENFNSSRGINLSKYDDVLFEKEGLKESDRTNELSFDGINPNTLGEILMAKSIAGKVKELMLIPKGHEINVKYKPKRFLTIEENINEDKKEEEIENQKMNKNEKEKKKNNANKNKKNSSIIIETEIYNRTYYQTSKFDSITEKKRFRPIISCVGDSLTRGFGSSNSTTKSYPALLSLLPAFTDFQVDNYGHSGTIVIIDDKGTKRSYWRTEEYRNAMNSNPNIVIIQFGTNDILGLEWNKMKFINDYVKLINQFKKLNNNPKIFINIPNPYYLNLNVNKNEEDKSEKEIMFNNIGIILPHIINKIGKISNSTVINLFHELGDEDLSHPELITEDLIHPNDLGYDKIANTIGSAISEDFEFLKLKSLIYSSLK